MDEEVKLEIDAGACRFKTIIIGSMQEDGNVKLKIKSECPMIRKMCKTMPTWDLMESITARIHKNPVMIFAGEHLEHPACPVPVGIIKVLESTSGMAVKKNVSMAYQPS